MVCVARERRQGGADSARDYRGPVRAAGADAVRMGVGLLHDRLHLLARLQIARGDRCVSLFSDGGAIGFGFWGSSV